MQKDLRFEEYFLFTQFSLKTFENCPLKFKKRYLENLKWDLLPDKNVMDALERGRNFHLLAQRYFMGIETGLDNTEEFEGLSLWVENLKKFFKIQSNTSYYPEHKMRMVTDKLKIEANFDLVVSFNDSIEIWDFKTYGSKIDIVKEGRRLKQSLQTIVYLYVLKEQIHLICSKDIKFENIKMIYWQPQKPHILSTINYSEEDHKLNGIFLENKIKNILSYDYENFNKETYESHCKFCEFNWFCNNKNIGFSKEEINNDFMDELSWDDIVEVF